MSSKEYYKGWYRKNRKKRIEDSKKYMKKWLSIPGNKEKAVIAQKKRYLSHRVLKTDWLYIKEICVFCKKEGIPLVKITKSKSGRQYYSCNECNTKKARKYRETKRGNKSIRKAIRKYEEKNPQKKLCWSKAIHIKKPTHCSMCNREDVIKHHKDYKKPLKVVFLCHYHHSQFHKALNGV